MRKLAIYAALFGIMTLAACGGQTPATTPTIDPTADVGPTPDATDNADTTSDTADANADPETSLNATVSGDALGAESPLEFTALGQYACQPPTTTDAGGQTTDVPGSMVISGLDEADRLVSIRMPFDLEAGEYEVDPGGGVDGVTVEIVLDPSSPDAVYRATSGTVTIDALPLVQGDRATGSFNVSAPQVTSGDGETALSATGSFDFVTDNTSIMCNRPDRGNN
jgi:hypothetical protein